MVDTVFWPLVKIVVLLNAVMVSVTFMTLLERKVIACCRPLPTRSS